MQVARKFEDETTKLAAAVKTGDLSATKAQFGAAASTCKAATASLNPGDDRAGRDGSDLFD